MYTQFFGNFLLSKGYITNEQLFDALKEKAQKHAKLGTLAIHSGLMTAAEVDSVIVEQTHQDKKFGELTIEMGYLTDEQVKDLLNIQSPDKDSINHLIGHFFANTGIDPSAIDIMYLELLFNSFIRFVGDDYTPLSAEICDSFSADCMVRQDIEGSYAIHT